MAFKTLFNMVPIYQSKIIPNLLMEIILISGPSLPTKDSVSFPPVNLSLFILLYIVWHAFLFNCSFCSPST